MGNLKNAGKKDYNVTTKSQCCIYNLGIQGTHISILRLAVFHKELGRSTQFDLSVPFLLNSLSFSVSLSLYIYQKIKSSASNQFFSIRLSKLPYQDQVLREKCDLKYTTQGNLLWFFTVQWSGEIKLNIVKCHFIMYRYQC